MRASDFEVIFKVSCWGHGFETSPSRVRQRTAPSTWPLLSADAAAHVRKARRDGFRGPARRAHASAGRHPGCARCPPPRRTARDGGSVRTRGGRSGPPRCRRATPIRSHRLLPVRLAVRLARRGRGRPDPRELFQAARLHRGRGLRSRRGGQGDGVPGGAVQGRSVVRLGGDGHAARQQEDGDGGGEREAHPLTVARPAGRCPAARLGVTGTSARREPGSELYLDRIRKRIAAVASPVAPHPDDEGPFRTFLDGYGAALFAFRSGGATGR